MTTTTTLGPVTTYDPADARRIAKGLHCYQIGQSIARCDREQFHVLSLVCQSLDWHREILRADLDRLDAEHRAAVDAIIG